MSDENQAVEQRHTPPAQGNRRDTGKGDANRRFYYKRKVCRFCTSNMKMNYRDPSSLSRYITERGKILPRRITGTCAKHQRALTREIKKARTIALLPFVVK